MFEGSCGWTNGTIRVSSSYNNKLNEKVSKLSSARSTSLVAYMVSATMRGRRVYSTEAYGNAYFFRGDGRSEAGTILCKEYNNVRTKGRILCG
jgi:hypothetical protein